MPPGTRTLGQFEETATEEPRASFFFGSGRNRLHHRRSSTSEPQLNSSRREHLLGSLYLPVSLTCALVISRDPATVTTSRRREFAVAGPLRPLSSFADHSGTLQVLHEYSCSLLIAS